MSAMSRRTDRRQFLQAIAASAAAATGACQTEDAPKTEGSGATAGAGTGGSAGTGGGGASGGQAGSGNQPPLTSPLGVALLGLGNYASTRLAPALQLTEHCKLRGIVTGTQSKVPMWQEQYGIESANVYSYDTMAGLIDNPNIHVVYVVTPNHVHMQYAIAAARAKKHVWCEKPMAMDAPECQAIIDACRENGVELCIGYRMRHEPNTQTIIGYASSRPFGAILDVVSQAGFRGFGTAADANAFRLKRAMGGGALYDMGLYAINAARYATGEEPIRVRNARQWTERPEIFTEVDEWTEFELEFPSGVIAQCRTSFGENIDSLDVTCESGSYRLAPMNAYTGVRGQTSDGTQLNQMIANQQAKQMDDDALALIERRAVLAPGEEGLQGVRIISAIQEAASTGQTVDL
jgi:glucose-fructose oxidoreductase